MPPSANSAGTLLQLFRSNRASTRSDVQNLTGLARSTVTYKIESLLEAGYLVVDGSIVDGRGRPATRLRVNDQATTVLVADLGATHGRLAVSTAGGEVLSETVIESAIYTGPSAVLATVAGELEKLLAESGRDPSTVRGVGLGVPGPVDWQTGRIARSISMPGWDDYPVRDHLREHFGVPAVVDNDANLLGSGEQQRIYPSAHLLIFVKVGTGVGLVGGRRWHPAARIRLGRGGHRARQDPRGHRDLQQLRSAGLPGCRRQRSGHGPRSAPAGQPSGDHEGRRRPGPGRQPGCGAGGDRRRPGAR